MSKYQNTTILIVDDDEQILNLLNTFLSDLGIKCNVAINGNEALERLNEKEFNIIITDFSMPGMNGLELITYIRKNDALNDIKIILMTGAQDPDVTKALSLSHGHMFKPFDFNHLKMLIDSFSIL